MKKFLLAILALLYIGTSAGATVHFHYCMGELVDWGFWHNKSDKCGNCGMEKTKAKGNGCCKDDHRLIKIENDQKVPESSIQIMQVVSMAIPAAFYELLSIALPSVTEGNPLCHAPPGSSGIAVYIRNCVFLI